MSRTYTGMTPNQWPAHLFWSMPPSSDGYQIVSDAVGEDVPTARGARLANAWSEVNTGGQYDNAAAWRRRVTYTPFSPTLNGNLGRYGGAGIVRVIGTAFAFAVERDRNWNPDGKQIAVREEGGTGLYVDTDTGEVYHYVNDGRATVTRVPWFVNASLGGAPGQPSPPSSIPPTVTPAVPVAPVPPSPYQPSQPITNPLSGPRPQNGRRAMNDTVGLVTILVLNAMRAIIAASVQASADADTVKTASDALTFTAGGATGPEVEALRDELVNLAGMNKNLWAFLNTQLQSLNTTSLIQAVQAESNAGGGGGALFALALSGSLGTGASPGTFIG